MTADILQFNSLRKKDFEPQDGPAVLTCGGCGCQSFVAEWPSGELYCARCGCISNNFCVVSRQTPPP